MNRSKSTTTPASTGQSPKRRRRAFQIKGRKGWHAEYKYHDGKTQRRTFETETLANDWLDEQVKVDDVASGPLLGGPERVTLGAFLGEYAFRFSIAKQSYESEISRINHYVEAANRSCDWVTKPRFGRCDGELCGVSFDSNSPT